MRSYLAAAVVAALALVVGCGSSSLKEAGEECVAWHECGAGLVVDRGRTPAVWSANVTADALVVDGPPGDAADPDAAITDGRVVDGAVIDGAVIDGAVIDAPAIDAPAIDAAVDAAVDAPPDA